MVSLNKLELVCDFKKFNRLSGGLAPATPVASVQRVRVPVGKAQLTVG